MDEEKQVNTDTTTLEDSFNLLVNLARNTKLTYQEHALVDKAIKAIHDALNKKEVSE